MWQGDWEHMVNTGLVFGEDGDLGGVGSLARTGSDPVQAQSDIAVKSWLVVSRGFRVARVT